MGPKAWYKLVKPQSDWDKVPLADVVDVADLKKQIKKEASPALDAFSASRLILAASKIDNKDASSAVEFDAESSLESILKRFGVEQTPSVHQSFADNIRLFINAPDGK